ncbi:MAG TPA: type IV pilus modification protein PilV [Xanthomonadales bacterium]|nr:type IV pilus modification protein PilV [Xanthomonadales bacterium]
MNRFVKNAGFTLIEVMIALAVLTIGLTGLAAMQLSAMQFSHSSHYRSLASTIALDFEERLWLDLADNIFACDPVDDWAGKVAELATDWNRAYLEAEQSDGDEDNEGADVSRYMLRIPGLVIEPGEATFAGSVVEIPVSLSWTESRFGDTESTTETFDYTVRIQCTTST